MGFKEMYLPEQFSLKFSKHSMWSGLKAGAGSAHSDQLWKNTAPPPPPSPRGALLRNTGTDEGQLVANLI